MLAPRLGRSFGALAVAASLSACASSPEAKADPASASPSESPPADATPRPEPVPAHAAPGRADDTGAAALSPERTPVPPATARVLESYVTGGLDVETAARSLDRELALVAAARGARSPAAASVLEGAPGWSVSSRRALVAAIQHAPAPLRDRLLGLEEPLAAPAAAVAAPALAEGRLAVPLQVADRYPCSPFADQVASALAALRGDGPHEVLDLSTLAGPLHEGQLAFEGIQIKADGQETLVATDGDKNRVWEYRLPPCDKGDEHWLRVLGQVQERIVALVVPHAGSPAFCIGLDATTGNEVFRVELFPLGRGPGGDLEPVDAALGGVEAVLAAPGRAATVDVRRGELAWRRTGLDAGRLASAGTERVVLAPRSGEGPGLELDLATGRRLAPGAAARPRSGTIEIK